MSNLLITYCKNNEDFIRIKSLKNQVSANKVELSVLVLYSNEFISDSEFYYIKVGPEFSFRPGWAHRFSFCISFLREMWRKYFDMFLICQKVRLLVRQKAISKILIQVNGQTTIWLSLKLIRSKKTVYNQLMLHLEDHFISNHVDYFSKKIFIKDYGCLVRNSPYVLSTLPVGLSHERVLCAPSHSLVDFNQTVLPSNKEKVVIGIIGKLHSQKTARHFLEALDSIYWQIDGKQVELHLWDNQHIPYKRTRMFNHQISDLVSRNILESCHIVYFNSSFELDHSFDKFFYDTRVLYLMLKVGEKLFFHGPVDHKASEYIRSKNLGVVCSSVSEEVLVFYLRKAFYESVSEDLRKRNLECFREKMVNYRFDFFKK